MKYMFCILGLFLTCNIANAASCPAGWEEIKLETATFAEETCPDGEMAYFQVNNTCTANVL